MTVIIPSAILVPEELRNLGNLPAVIYPIEGKPVFHYLYKQYAPYCSRFKIICCLCADLVHHQLESYDEKKVVIEDIPDSELKDLGHTIYYGLQDLNDSVVVNFADTIVLNDITAVKGDAFYYADDEFSEKWTYFEEKDGTITEIYDKVPDRQGSCGRLFVGVFQIADTAYFRKCLKKAFCASGYRESSFYHALKLYSQLHPMQPIRAHDWLDIGHIDRYYNSKLEVSARQFNHIYIDTSRGILRKSSDEKEKFIGEIAWYLKLPKDVEYVRPRIFDYSLSYGSPYVAMEYYAYHTLHELYLFGDLSGSQWDNIFQRIRFVCSDLKKYSVKDEKIRPSLEEMYLTKVLRRMDQLRSSPDFFPFFDRDITINGKAYKSLNDIQDIMKDMIPKLLFDVDQFCIIHGDMCFSNIMIDGNLSFVKLIDPRGKFGAFDIYGDFRYELAKLLHSIDGKYDYIIEDLFRVEYDLSEASAAFEVQTRKDEIDFLNIFVDVFSDDIGEDLNKIEFIEALLFLSMIPLHKESLKRQVVMLGTGLEIMNRVIDISR